jgi:hypothetical protein
MISRNKGKSRYGMIIYLVLLSIVLGFIFLTMDYTDGRTNAGVGYQLCRGALTGHFSETYNSLWMAYGVTIYVIYAIWSIPVVLTDFLRNRVTDFSTCIYPYLWYKIMLMMFVVLCAYWIYQISCELLHNKFRSHLLALLFVTSAITVFPVLEINQCDIITLSFVLAGIFYLMKEKDVPFILLFAISATMKYFSLFIFIPLVLYRYKKSRKLYVGCLATGAVVLCSLFVTTLSSHGKDMFANSENYVQGQVDKIFVSSILELGMGEMNLMVAYFVVICLAALLVTPKNQWEYKRWIPWFSLAGIYTMFLFYFANTYWYVMLAPFFVLLCINNRKRFNLGLKFEILLTNAMLIERIIAQKWVFGGKKTFVWLLLKKHAVEDDNLLYNVLNNVLRGRLDDTHSMWIGVIVVLAFAVLYVFRPDEQEGHPAEGITPSAIMGANWAHLLILYVWSGLMIIQQIKTSWI